MKSHTKIFLFNTLHMWRSKAIHSEHVKTNSVNPLYFMFNKMNGYFKEINENRYLTLVPINEWKEKTKKYE